MRKYFNLALNFPIILVAVLTLLPSMNILSAVLLSVVSIIMIKSTTTDRLSAIQLFPAYIAGAMLCSLSLWVPVILANRNAEIRTIASVVENLSQNANTQLIPLYAAIAISVLSAITAGVLKKPAVSSVLLSLSINAVCFSVITVLFNGSYLEKLSYYTGVITLLYSAVFQRDNRISDASLTILTIFLNLLGIIAYFVASSYIEFTLAPAILQALANKKNFWYVTGILVYMLITHFVSLAGTKSTPEIRSTNAGAVTIPVLYITYRFASVLYPEKYFLWIAALLPVVVCILVKAVKNGRYTYTYEYVLSLLFVASDIILVALFLGRKELCSTLFANDIVFYTICIALLISAIAIHPRTSYGFLFFGIAVIAAGYGYSFNMYVLPLLIAITLAGFILIRKAKPSYIYSLVPLLVLALIPTYFLSPNAGVFVYTDSQGAAGSKTLENSLLCVLADDSAYSKGDMKVSWSDGEVIENLGFPKIFTRLKPSQKMTVSQTNSLGIKRTQSFSYKTEGHFGTPYAEYNKIANGYEALRLIAYDKASLRENELPIKRGDAVENASDSSTLSYCVSMASRKNAKAIEYVIVDSQNKVISDGYVANRAYIDIAIPHINQDTTLRVIAIDENYNTTPVTEWQIITATPQ